MLCCRAAVALSARVGGHVVGDNSRTRATPARVGRVRRTTLVTVAAATSDAASRRAALGALTLGGLSVAGFGALPPVAQAGGLASPLLAAPLPRWLQRRSRAVARIRSTQATLAVTWPRSACVAHHPCGRDGQPTSRACFSS
jgi:hypothetical protein